MAQSRLASLVVLFLAVSAFPLRAQDTSPETPAQKPPDRVFGVLPNFGTVEDSSNVPPITTAQRFRIASLDTFDPFVYPFVAFTAGVADLRGQESTWNHGAVGYARHYAAAFSDNAIGNMMTTAILPTVFNQDPRYIVLHSGGFWHRVTYAASRSVITRGGHGQSEFNVSEIGGNAVGAALSNFYYPSDSRSVGATLERWEMQVLWDTLANELKEFWPDLRRALHRH